MLNVQVNGLIILEIKFCCKLKLSKCSASRDYLPRLHHQYLMLNEVSVCTMHKKTPFPNAAIQGLYYGLYMPLKNCLLAWN